MLVALVEWEHLKILVAFIDEPCSSDALHPSYSNRAVRCSNITVPLSMKSALCWSRCHKTSVLLLLGLCHIQPSTYTVQQCCNLPIGKVYAVPYPALRAVCVCWWT